VIHPFHPLYGREFELVTQKQAWGEDRVYFRDRAKRLQHIPLGWTSVAPADAFRAAAGGRCRFRTEDLLRLADLVHGLTPPKLSMRKAKDAGRVKKTTPSDNSGEYPETRRSARNGRAK
jgi:hypothetical protein